MKRSFGRRLMGLSFACGLSLSQADSGWADEVSLSRLLQSIDDDAAVTRFNEQAELKRQARFSSRTRLVSPIGLEFTAEVGENFDKPTRFESTVKQTYRLGRSKTAVDEATQLELEAEGLDLKAELREQKATLAQIYLDLLNAQRKAAAATTTLTALRPMLETFNRAVSAGTASSLSGLKWRLFAKRVENDLMVERGQFAVLAKTIAQTTGVVVAEDPAKAVLTALKAPESFDVVVDDDIKIRALRASSKAKLLNARQEIDQYEISAGLGVARDVKAESNSYLLSVGFSLGQDLVNRSYAAEIANEAAQLHSRETILSVGLGRRHALLQGKLTAGASALKASRSLVDDLRQIYETSVGGLGRGFSEAAVVVEALEALHEARVVASAVERGYEEALVEYFLLKGRIP